MTLWLGRLALLLPKPAAEHVLIALGWIAPAVAVAVAALAGWWAARLAIAVLRWAFHGFNAGFQAATRAYVGGVGGLIRVVPVALVVYAGLLGLTYWEFMITPKGFVPPQDMGYLIVSLQTPDATSAERTRAITDHVQDICRSTTGVKHTLAVAGMSFAFQVNASNFGSMFVILDDFDKREEPGLYGTEIANTLRKRLAAEVPGARRERVRPRADTRRRPHGRIQRHGRGPPGPRLFDSPAAGRFPRRQGQGAGEPACRGQGQEADEPASLGQGKFGRGARTSPRFPM